MSLVVVARQDRIHLLRCASKEDLQVCIAFVQIDRADHAAYRVGLRGALPHVDSAPIRRGGLFQVAGVERIHEIGVAWVLGARRAVDDDTAFADQKDDGTSEPAVEPIHLGLPFAWSIDLSGSF